MGGDVSVFEEGELERSFWQYHGPNDESLSNLFQRTIKGNINQRKCTSYEASDTIPDGFRDRYAVKEMRLISSGVVLNCLHWINTSEVASMGMCIIYIHTNTRASIDAAELLPLCSALQCDLFAFDLPGCGKSGGTLSTSMACHASEVIKYLKTVLMKEELVVWARGMGTGVAVELATSEDGAAGDVRFMVLDSPFTSTRQMINEAVEKVRKEGYYIPSTLVDLSTFVTRKAVKHYYKGTDPLDVKPLKQVGKVKHLMVPCHIFSATHDDYISAQQGYELAMAWTGPCTYQTFEGGHFGTRAAEMVESVASAILEKCRQVQKASVELPDTTRLCDEAGPMAAEAATRISSGSEGDAGLMFDADDVIELNSLGEEQTRLSSLLNSSVKDIEIISSDDVATSMSTPTKQIQFSGFSTLSPKFFHSRPLSGLYQSTSGGVKKSQSSNELFRIHGSTSSAEPNKKPPTGTALALGDGGIHKSKSMISLSSNG